MSLTIYGASDDLIEVEGHYVEEYNVYGNDFAVRLTDPEADERMDIVLTYGGNGCWSAGARRFDEGKPMPWPVQIVTATHCEYSSAAVIDCPPTVEVSLIGGEA